MRHDFYEAKIPSKLQKLAFFAKFTQNLNLKMFYYEQKKQSCGIILKELTIV
jgi:hypothetical protein